MRIASLRRFSQIFKNKYSTALVLIATALGTYAVTVTKVCLQKCIKMTILKALGYGNSTTISYYLVTLIHALYGTISVFTFRIHIFTDIGHFTQSFYNVFMLLY